MDEKTIMQKENYQLFQNAFPHTIRDYLLADLTSMKIGGPADLYIPVVFIDQVPSIIHKAKELNINYLILAGGTNTIFHENGFRGLIIHIKANHVVVDGDRISADAGAPLARIIQLAKENNLTGLEPLTGLPGTIGGAVRGNAGAFGVEIGKFVEEVSVFSQETGIRNQLNDYFDFQYRNSKIKQQKGAEIILQVCLKLTKATTEEINRKIELALDSLKKRQINQPVGKTSGSFFKNPSLNQPAGQLLDQAGCKGLKAGDVQVSQMHANWFMNNGNATQSDVIKLAKMAIQRVKEQFGIVLEPEVQLIDEKGFMDIVF